MKSFFGYPGGKSRAAKKIIERADLNGTSFGTYIEPFAGGFSFGLSCLGYDGVEADRVLINDLDADIYCLWVAAIDYTEEFCEMIMGHYPTVDDFYVLRDKLKKRRPFPQQKKTILHRALDKLVVHKISYSNMGEMSGSPVGGKNQTGDWKFDCRWNQKSICQAIWRVAKKLEGTEVSCLPYDRIRYPSDSLVFVDPPYVEAGKKCYKHSFTESDHIKLARWLDSADFMWVVTYDTHPLILDLYQDWNIYDLEFNYFMSSAYRSGKEMKIGKELLITNY